MALRIVSGEHGAWRFWPRRLRSPSRTAERSAGYNLVILAVAVTVLNILVAKALPLWSHVIQREKEEELIFRGLQYAEALRIFEINNGRPPNKLEELMADGQRRYIRQLWTNPMTEDGKWGLIFLDSAPRQQGQNPGQNPDRQGRLRQDRRFGAPGDGQEVRVGPIIGVYSPVGGEAIKVFSPLGGGGGSEISQWRFTKDLLQGLGDRGVGAGDGMVQVPTMNAEDIGKPWPPGINMPRLQAPRRGAQGRGGGAGQGGAGTGQRGQNRPRRGNTN